MALDGASGLVSSVHEPFYNRVDELDALQERWESGRAEFVVIYGRRRVGKSHLISHFAEGRRHLYFEATSGSRGDHLEDLSREIAAVSGREVFAEQPLGTWRAAFTALGELLEDGPLFLVIDEFQFVARQEPEIGSLINRFWSQHRGNGGLMLCLAGSDIGFIEQEVLGYAATSYGRRTGSLRIQPFAPHEIAPFVPGWSADDRIRTWAVLGGMPYYLAEIDPELDLRENIFRIVLAPDGLLRDEPAFLLSQETRIRNRDAYMSVLRAIAAGATRLNAIAQRIGKARSEEARPLCETLEEMGLVERRYPVTSGKGKRVHYAITDPFLRFWFRFVGPFESRLQTRRRARQHLDETVGPDLDHFVSGDGFEEVCQDWLLRHLPDAAEVGWWWGNRREREAEGLVTKRYEADAVAITARGRVIALGSCKWSDTEHQAGELDKLEIIRDKLLKAGRDADLYFFDRTGFSRRLREIAAKSRHVHLVSSQNVVSADEP